jgi:hypothetical protein
MYFIAIKGKTGDYYIDEIQTDWHTAIDRYEPIDCVDAKMLVFDETGRKFLIGPHKELKKKKLFWKLSSVEVGSWDTDSGEPFLIDTNEVVLDELRILLLNYLQRIDPHSDNHSLTSTQLIAKLPKQ